MFAMGADKGDGKEAWHPGCCHGRQVPPSKLGRCLVFRCRNSSPISSSPAQIEVSQPHWAALDCQAQLHGHKHGIACCPFPISRHGLLRSHSYTCDDIARRLPIKHKLLFRVRSTAHSASSTSRLFKMLSSLVVPFTLANAVLAAYSFDPLEHLAGIAPYFEPEDPPLDPASPQGCNVTRAAYLIRHAAIYANDFDYEEYIEPFTDKLGNTSVNWANAGPLAFLAGWKTPIEDEEVEELTKVGEMESFALGSQVRVRYPGLKRPQKVWTSTAERTEKSAKSFVQGIAAGSNDTQIVSVPESKAEGADSLTPYQGCPKYSSSAGSKQSAVRTTLSLVRSHS